MNVKNSTRSRTRIQKDERQDRTGRGTRTLHDTAAAASSSTTARLAVCCTLVFLAALNISRRLHSRVELSPGPFSG